MTSPSLTVFGHYVSQPVRAVVWTLAMKSTPYNFVKINPVVGEAETPEFLSKFPTGVVPALQDDSRAGKPFYLTESTAILPYLCDQYSWSDLYPTDHQHRAKIQQWLSWHHGNLRSCTTHIFRPAMLQVMGKTPKTPDAKFVERFMKENMLVLKYEGRLHERPFLTGDAPTIADISAYCELDQLWYGKLFDFEPFPEVASWMKKMQQLPQHDEIRRSLFKLCEKFQSKL